MKTKTLNNLYYQLYVIKKKTFKRFYKFKSNLLYNNTSKYIILPRHVQWGNILYFLVQSEIKNKKLLTSNDKIHYWIAYFPGFKKQIKYVKFLKDQEVTNYYQFINEDFSLQELQKFIQKYFSNNNLVLDYKNKQEQEDVLYIHVRRGDYYSNSLYKSYYGFDIVGFIQFCFISQNVNYQKNIVVESDDIKWCKDNLQFLTHHTDKLIFSESKPIEAFLSLSTAKKILMTNSTFAYWAGYISNSLYKGENEMYVPNFVSRISGYDKNKQFLTNWKIIKDFDCFNSRYNE